MIHLAPLLLLGAAAVLATPKPKRVLFVVSAAKVVRMKDDSKMEAGYWANEFAVPARALQQAGYEIDVVTPFGQVPVADTHSLKAGESDETLRKEFPGLAKPGELSEYLTTQAENGKWAAIVIPGGYSPMVDLLHSKELGFLLRKAMAHKIVIASICHGPAAFLSAKNAQASWPFAGVKMTSFTDGEEKAWLKDRAIGWTIESELKKNGAAWSGAAPWESHVVRDGNVITGQSSPSTAELTRVLLDALR